MNDTITTADGRTVPLSELEGVARAATPGPRRFVKRIQVKPGSRRYHCPREDGEEPICGTVNGTIVVKTGGGLFCAADESHIATFDRDVCLALVAEVRRLRERVAQLEALLREVASTIQDFSCIPPACDCLGCRAAELLAKGTGS